MARLSWGLFCSELFWCTSVHELCTNWQPKWYLYMSRNSIQLQSFSICRWKCETSELTDFSFTPCFSEESYVWVGRLSHCSVEVWRAQADCIPTFLIQMQLIVTKQCVHLSELVQAEELVWVRWEQLGVRSGLPSGQAPAGAGGSLISHSFCWIMF